MRVRQRLIGLGALVVLAAILVGLPALLLTLGGNPLPATLPTFDQARDALLSPDDGTLALAGTKLLGWVVWAALSVSIVVEAVSVLRGVRAPALPVLALPQSGMRPLVIAALALFIAAPTGISGPATASASSDPVAATAPVTATAPLAAVQTPHSTPTTPVTTTTTSASAMTERASMVSYEVRPGDTLWAIAEQHLGSGHAYHRIVDLNPELLIAGVDRITPGMRLHLPTGTLPASSDQSRLVIVEPGDTLSGLAAEHLGEATRWPEIYDASTGTVQPDGRRLEDPDLIYPGWHLNLPAPTTGFNSPDLEDKPRAATGDQDRTTGQDTTVAPTRARTTPPAVAHTDTDPGGPATGSVLTAARASAVAGTSLGLVAPAGPGAPSPVSGGHESGDMSGDVQVVQPSWVLDGIVGSGALLGGALFMALTRARRAQARKRRPGRALPPAPAVLAPVEKTLQTQGAAAAPTLEHLDEVLRRLGASRAHDGAPALAAAELSAAGLLLHLASPTNLTAPWQPTAHTDDDTGLGTDEGTGEGLGWLLPAGTPVAEVGPLPADAPAPYPLLVTIGTEDDGTTWLLNLEGSVVTLTGAGEYVADLARYLAAEIAVNPWSVGARLDCVGIAEQVAGMNPARLRVGGPGAVDDLLTEALGVLDRLGHDWNVPTARVRQEAEDTWPARAVLIEAATALERPAGRHLAQLITTHPGRTSASLLLTGTTPVVTGSAGGLSIEATATGRVLVPSLGLDLVGVGLTDDEAAGCAAMLAHARDESDTSIPPAAPAGAGPDVTGDQGWRAWADQAGALLCEHTIDRHRPGSTRTLHAAVLADGSPEVEDVPLLGGASANADTHEVIAAAPADETTQNQETGEPQYERHDTGERVAATLLEADDDTYQDEAATTAADLALLSPGVPDTVGEQVLQADPGLDADLAAWWDEEVRAPRLRLLGPVRARTWGRPLVERKAYVTELLAYLALHPGGVTAAQIAEAFGITQAKTRDYINRCREWLGTDPANGTLHLPHAQDSPAARERGGNVYQVLGVLVDVDLFRRLRVRAEARGGPAGIADLKEALRLVEGTPFGQLRRGGWAWLYEGDRIDHHMVCAVVDVAHVVATHDLTIGDLPGARAAAQVAHLAAPYEEITTLDLAAITAREGHTHQAVQLLKEQVCNRTDDPDMPPADLPERTQQIIDRRRWLQDRSRAV